MFRVIHKFVVTNGFEANNYFISADFICAFFDQFAILSFTATLMNGRCGTFSFLPKVGRGR